MRGIVCTCLLACITISIHAQHFAPDLEDVIKAYCPLRQIAGADSLIALDNNYHDKEFIHLHNAHIHYRNTHFTEAHEALNQALIFASTDSPYRFLYEFLKARIFLQKQLNQKALTAFHNAFSIGIQQQVDTQLLAYISKNIGTAYLNNNNYKQALSSFRFWEKSYSSLEQPAKQAKVFHNIGLCYFHLRHYDSAEVYLKRSFNLEQELQDTLGIAISYMDMANLYYEQYKDNLAIPLFIKGLAYAKLTDDKKTIRNAHLNMAVVEENRKQYTEALKHRKAYEKLQKAIWHEDKVWELAKQEKQFEISLNESEITLLEERNRVQDAELATKNWQRNSFFSISITLLFIVIGSLWAYRKLNNSNKVILQQKDELENLNHTKNQLFSLVAHDLKSPVWALQQSQQKLAKAIHSHDIQTLKHIASENEKVTADTYRVLDNLLQWALAQTNQLSFLQESIPMKRLVDQVVYDYQHATALKDIDLTIHLVTNVLTSVDVQSMKSVLRNLLDNAIKFTSPFGKITITDVLDQQDMLLTISDTGCGMSSTQLTQAFDINQEKVQQDTDGKKGTGLGLVLCQSLIHKNHGQLHIESEIGKGTSITIRLPIALEEPV